MTKIKAGAAKKTIETADGTISGAALPVVVVEGRRVRGGAAVKGVIVDADYIAGHGLIGGAATPIVLVEDELQRSGAIQPMFPVIPIVTLEYLLRDEFTTALPAGSVNGTAAEPGPGTRDVVDTGSNLDISGGTLNITGSVSNSDPRLNHDGFSQVAGRLLVIQFSGSDLNQIYCGWDNATTGTPDRYVLHAVGASGIRVRLNGSIVGVSTVVLAAATTYKVSVVLRTVGAYFFIQGGVFTNWILLWEDLQFSSATMYGVVSSINANFNVDFMRVPDTIFLPTPLLYDIFTTIPTAVDSGTNGLNGVYNRVGLGGVTDGAFFDGVNSFNNIYSANLNTEFDGNEGALIARAKVANVDVWTDGNNRVIITIRVDSNNQIFINSPTSNNQVQIKRDGDGVSKNVTITGITAVNTQTYAIYWSVSGDEQQAYFNGATQGAAASGLGTWSGALSSTQNVIGAFTDSPTLVWNGFIGDVIITLSGANITDIDNKMFAIHTSLDAGTLTTANLDTHFGAGNWAWWRQDEQYLSDASGPDSQTTPVRTMLGSTGALDGSGELGITPITGSELFTDPGLENWTSSTDLTDWTEFISGGNSVNQETTIVHGGSNAARLGIADQVQAADIRQQITLSAGEWVSVSCWARRATVTQSQIRITNGQSIVLTLTDTYQQFEFTDKPTANNPSVLFERNASGGTGSVYYDDTSAKLLTLSTLIHGAQITTLDTFSSVELTITDDTQAGFMLRLDDPATPAALVHIYCDRVGDDIIVADVTGATTYTVRSTTAFTYSAGATLKVDLEGTNYRVYYNDALIVNSTNISTATGTYTAMFATDAATRFDNFTIFPKGTGNEYSRLDDF